MLMGWFFDRVFGWLGRRVRAVHADSAALHAVGVDLTPRAEGLPEVRMRAEEVNIYLFANLAVVEATFELENEGPEAEIEVGFPQFRSQSPFKAQDVMPLGFHVEVDGQAVAHVDRQLDNVFYPMWYAWKQRFAAGQTSTVAVRYWVPLISYHLCSRMPFTYVLRTGRFWKGLIGHAVVRVHASDIPLTAIQEATPPSYRIDRAAKTLTWEFRNLMPDDDIGLLISPNIIQAALGGMAADDLLDINERRPPTGTRVLIGGKLMFGKQGQSGISFQRGIVEEPVLAFMSGERNHDGSTVIPDRIKVFRSTDQAINKTPVILTPRTLFREHDISYLNFGTHLKEWISGTVRYHKDMLFIKADERISLRDDMSEPYANDILKARFPWVDRAEKTRIGRDEWSEVDREQLTRWPGGATRYRDGEHFYGTQSDERAKVDHGEIGRSDAAVRQVGRFLIARVEGNSMQPTLAPGDIVFAQRVQRVREGRVALVRIGPRWLIKRIVRYHEDGESCLLGVEAPFGWVPRAAIQARVVGTYRIGRGFARL
jgi:hypothetical protein